MMPTIPCALFSRTSANAKLRQGEKRYGVLVHGDKLAEQPIRSTSDFNDDMWSNIGPALGAEVLRHHKKSTPNITRDNERDNDAKRASLFKMFKGDRITAPNLTPTGKEHEHV
ncbi:hypothetical protein [Variovorax sp. 38R]|uniref:hypothetical protein n=1 Tax=Variovorax sp. 38R TaxID=2774875 RepID=UPI00177AB93E|nr:hypothetical protein [Variovorax sp. 38R]QOF77153.1 hypothetical protein IG196_22740 [Variovorax sp. 38R]